MTVWISGDHEILTYLPDMTLTLTSMTWITLNNIAMDDAAKELRFSAWISTFKSAISD